MGSIRKLPNGRWQAQFRPIPGGRQITRTTQKKTDAQQWLNEQQALLTTGHFADPNAGKITFGTFYNSWSARQIWVPGTRRGMDFVARSVQFWHTPLRLIRRSDIEVWVKWMETTRSGNRRAATAKDGLSPETILVRFVQVRLALKAAVDEKLIPTDPTIGVKLPRRPRAASSMRLPSIQQVRALLAAANPDFRPFVALCAFAGLRRGEALALKAGDFDFIKKTVEISRQAQETATKRLQIRAPKYGSQRDVGLAGKLAEIIRRHLDRKGHPDAESWLFDGGTADPMSLGQLYSRWYNTCRRAGVHGVRMHDLRHFFASGLIASGCDVVTVQRALGHSSSVMTLSTYAHLWPHAEDRTRGAIDAIMSEVIRSTDE